MWKLVARGFGILWVATSVVVLLGALLGAFGIKNLFQVFDMALTLSIVSGISFGLLAWATWKLVKPEEPGLAVPTGIAVLACMVGIWLVGRVVPGTVLFSSFWLGLPFAALNVALIWGLQIWVTGRKPNGPMWPVLKP
jgi:hypothetical protein